jgi:hypothetical protein
VNYIGHAVPARWATEGILTDADLSNVASAFAAPVVFSMSCDFGRFGQTGSNTLAENLVLKPDGGAVAVWAAADLAYSAESRILNQAAFESLFVAGTPRLGDAIRDALVRYNAEGHMAFMAYVYNLLGDPATLASNDAGF